MSTHANTTIKSRVSTTRLDHMASPEKHRLLRLTLPIPPSINAQYATVNGRRVSTAIARRFKQHVHGRLTSLEHDGKLPNELREHLRQSYLSLFLAFYFETPLKRDL